MKLMKTAISSTGKQLGSQIRNVPLIGWVLLAFLITYFLFLVIPVFLDPSLTMQFNVTIPVISPIAFDFRGMVGLSSQWIQTGAPPVIVYPSFTLLFFSVFTLFSWELGYRILLVLILLCFIYTTLLLPSWMNKTEAFSALGVLLLVTGLLSYGLQFEMERGQWNLIAFTFCLTGIYLFHHQPKLRPLAYLLFSVSIQLKLFPAIFVFTLIDDFRDWKGNVRRFLALGLANILALLILGINPVLHAIGTLVATPSSRLGRPFNHSIASFTTFFISSDLVHQLFPHKRAIAWLTLHSWILQIILFGVFFLCFVALLWRASRKPERGFTPRAFPASAVRGLTLSSPRFDNAFSSL